MWHVTGRASVSMLKLKPPHRVTVISRLALKLTLGPTSLGFEGRLAADLLIRNRLALVAESWSFLCVSLHRLRHTNTSGQEPNCGFGYGRFSKERGHVGCPVIPLPPPASQSGRRRKGRVALIGWIHRGPSFIQMLLTGPAPSNICSPPSSSPA